MKAIHRVFDVDFLTSKSKLVSLHSAVSAAGSKKYPAIASPEPLKVQERSTSYQAGEHWRVPIFRSVLASAGNGSGQSQLEASEEHLSFSHQYMRRHFGRVGDGFAMIYVRGDSMQPGLFDGDEIVIDTQQKRVDRDGIYVITLRGDLKVKRIQQRLDGSLLVKSDNLAYETEAVSAQQAEEFSVVGRMVWPRLR